MMQCLTRALVVLLLCVAACVDDEGSSTPEEATECEPGTSFSCSGPLGCRGTSVCRADGTRSPCDCESVPIIMDAAVSMDELDASTDDGTSMPVDVDPESDSGQDLDDAGNDAD